MALTKVESGGERTPPKPTEEELIALQIRRRLSMRKAASLSESRAVKQLLDMKARVTRATKQTLEYLEWLPDDLPLPTIEEQADGGGRCGRHGRDRPPRCGEFPLWQPALESELREHGAVRLHTDAFPRCSWYRACVVADDDPRLQQPPG